MLLEGVVTNVTNFGAFVDIGVHQDGLVHISMMSHKFIKDPRELVKAGDVVKVKVLEVDLQRRRIALTMKLDEAAPRNKSEQPSRTQPPQRAAQPPGDRDRSRAPAKPREREAPGNGVMAEALARALKR
jgi:uncharacterized protein